MAKQSGTKTVALQELTVSSMLSIEAMVWVLVKRGALAEKEVLDELWAVRLVKEEARRER